MMKFSLRGIFFLVVLAAFGFGTSGRTQTPEYKPRGVHEIVVRDGIGNTLSKLGAGKEVRVAYLGGSITETGDGWRPQTTAWLQSAFPNAAIHEIHAAIGATGSNIGVYRMDRDVLGFKPDLLFVEFAVNDGGFSPENIWRQLEGIIRKTWRADPKTDIVFCYTIVAGMIDGYRKGENPQTVNAMEQLADFYGIPSVNFGPGVVRLLDEKKLIFSGDSAPEGTILFSKDATHPIAEGSRLYTLDIERFFREARDISGVDHAPKLDRTFIVGNFEKARLFPVTESMLRGTWRKLKDGERYGYYRRWLDEVWTTETPGSRLEFQFRGSRVLLYDVPATNGGQIRITVDGVSSGPFPRFHPYWWSRLDAFPAAENLDPAQVHSVTVELDAAAPDRSRRDSKVDPAAYEGLRWMVGQIMTDGEIVTESP